MKNKRYFIIGLVLSIAAGGLFALGAWQRPIPIPTPITSTAAEVIITVPREEIPRTLPAPVFSHEGGAYREPFFLEINGNGATVRYTTDGSEPTINSPIFGGRMISYTPATRENSPMTMHGVGRANVGYWNLPGAGAWNDYAAFLPRFPQGHELNPHNLPRWPSMALPPGGEAGYFEPRPVFTGTVIRAAAFDAHGESSETVTHSFFVDGGNLSWRNMRIVSVAIEPQHFICPRLGIYRNWMREGGQPRHFANVEVFGDGGELLANQNALVWVFGNWSRWYPERSLRMNFNQGDGDITGVRNLVPNTRRHFYAPTETVQNFRHLNARTSDIDGTNLRDAFSQLMSEPLRPVIQNVTYGAVFINGEFWGMYNLHTHRHEHLIGEIFDVPRGSVQLEGNRFLQEIAFPYIAAPTGANYARRCPCCNSHHTTRAWFDHLNTVMCMDDFIDYFIIAYHFENWDWISNNMEMWRTTEYFPNVHGGDTRWRFIVQDFDNAIFCGRNNMLNYFTALPHEDIGVAQPWNFFLDIEDFRRGERAARAFRVLLQNPYFRNTFAARYSTYTGTAFHPARAARIINEQVASRQPTVGRNLYRWGWHISGDIRAVPWNSTWVSMQERTNNWLGHGSTWPPHTIRGGSPHDAQRGQQHTLFHRASTLAHAPASFNTWGGNSIEHMRQYFNRPNAGAFPRENLGLQIPEGYTRINWRTDSNHGWFNIAGAQIRADLFSRGDLASYNRVPDGVPGFTGFSIGNFSARYLRTLPVEATIIPRENSNFLRFELSGAENATILGDLTRQSITIIPSVSCREITVTAIFEGGNISAPSPAETPAPVRTPAPAETPAPPVGGGAIPETPTARGDGTFPIYLQAVSGDTRLSHARWQSGHMAWGGNTNAETMPFDNTETSRLRVAAPGNYTLILNPGRYWHVVEGGQLPVPGTHTHAPDYNTGARWLHVTVCAAGNVTIPASNGRFWQTEVNTARGRVQAGSPVGGSPVFLVSYG
ncbi:MAG: CotH kinase family protein [Defluviitaleaceae bacterium]|nr:CotH kinase family protein [Defluviitaleaceae bacterium]MCL2264163.1 CotH kinase family protein [Defluviitaleaceae bacterium]